MAHAAPQPNPDEVQNALSELFPLGFRKKAYAVFVLLGLALFVIVSVLTLMGNDLPVWLQAVNAGWNLVSSLGFTVARANAGRAGLT